MREKLERGWERAGSRGGSIRRRENGGKAAGASDGDQGWITVTGRRKRNVTSFYFSHFPDNFDAQSMWGVFGKYGKVKEVVIPNRVNRAGLRFGFARFWDVVDCRYMERWLDNILIGNLKLHVNLPRFQKENEVTGMKAKGQRFQDGRRTESLNHAVAAVHNLKQGRPCIEHGIQGGGGGSSSYKNALMDGNKGKSIKKPASFSLDEKELELGKGCSIEIEEKVEPWLQNSLVGIIKDVTLLNNIQDMFVLAGGLHYVRARYLGDNMVLLTGEEGADVNEIWGQSGEWFDEHFSAIYPWRSDLTPEKRLIWLRCEGIPLNLWNEKFFQSVTREIGELIAIAGETT
ncbi:uncharacterized protein LOC130712264 [Lotus japonicus]|uniref:uncharacterized protein LOC130712264 n=1 Tax=Lotus japonicus TaxID=34305 RepID=UPI00258DE78A|nr:uncharacterized protein LOC130712264 [Lotus japonicus]